MPAGLIEVTWRVRARPLEAVAVVGRGPVAHALADRVLRAPESWSGVVGDRLLVVVGEDLPWVDGVTYLGRAHPALWLDTRREPDVPLDWLVQRLCRSGPVAWVHEPDALVPLAELAPLHLPTLQAWRSRG